MRIAELGEFGLIDRLQRLVAGHDPDVVVGIGDDVAVLRTDGERLLLATVDAQVETVHFLRRISSAEQIGWRALAVNLSDIAAMGGRPRWALVSLALPADSELAWVEALYSGLGQAARTAGVSIVGGNLTRCDGPIMIDITVLGEVARDLLLTRAGARPGDRILVTGALGEAAAGLRLALRPELELDAAARAALLARYLMPQPRLAEAAIIAAARQATAMIDLSDGLSSDIGHICRCSGVGARIDAARLPISAATEAVARQQGLPAWELALNGGEDYELCFTAPPQYAAALAEAVCAATGTPVRDVGEILPAERGQLLILPDGTQRPLAAGGWNHFRTTT
ncbi:thiamine-phosphate kinase [Kallotenue papyrolyticum]|uniref:thiamine-phosphate kinase n=1 Tax=Kallotenue papyrolyticum TaxID=1325125 RepID=UPI000478616B|nr:thiamine-phosphate kinase [Kallotenue papyrolyticum]